MERHSSNLKSRIGRGSSRFQNLAERSPSRSCPRCVGTSRRMFNPNHWHLYYYYLLRFMAHTGFETAKASWRTASKFGERGGSTGSKGGGCVAAVISQGRSKRCSEMKWFFYFQFEIKIFRSPNYILAIGTIGSTTAVSRGNQGIFGSTDFDASANCGRATESTQSRCHRASKGKSRNSTACPRVQRAQGKAQKQVWSYSSSGLCWVSCFFCFISREEMLIGCISIPFLH